VKLAILGENSTGAVIRSSTKLYNSYIHVEIIVSYLSYIVHQS